MITKRLVFIIGLGGTLSLPLSASQKNFGTELISPASPQAKNPQPASHVTQGTIASLGANQLVLNRKGHGNGQQVTFVLNSQTQQIGNLTAGSRVSVQYRVDRNQKIASAVREVPPKSAARLPKVSPKRATKS
jgi:hypothetical protein